MAQIINFLKLWGGGGVKQQSLGTQAELLQGAMSLIAGYINES